MATSLRGSDAGKQSSLFGTEAMYGILQAAVEAAYDMVIVTDQFGVIRYANSAFTRVTGWRQDEVIGRKPSILKSGRHDEAFYRGLWDTVRAGQVWRGHMINRRRNGELYTEEMTITPVPGKNGELEHFVAIKRDVSEQTRALEELRLSEQRYRALFNMSSDAILLADAETGKLLDANRSAEQLLGRSLRNLIGLHHLELHPQNQHEKCARMFEQNRREAGLGECMIQRPDGSLVPVEVAGAPLRIGDRDVVQGHFRDISARLAAEQAEIQSRNLQAALTAMQRVLGVVGHELRTPLAALRATSEFLLDSQTIKTPQSTVFLRSIHDESVRMAQLVNNLLEAARLNSGVARWDWATVPLLDACHEAVSISGALIDDQAVRVYVEVDPPELTMRGDDGAIRRLLINLITNSAKFTKQGWIRIGMQPLTRADGQWIELTVQDTGDGMNDQVIAKLGQAFILNSGAVGSDYIKGTGLGLSICKSIASAHGGTITVSSEAGHGSTFTVLLRSDLPGPMVIDHDSTIRREEAA